MSFMVLKDNIFFTRLKSSDQEKENYVVVEFSLHNPRQEAQSENPATTLTKTVFPQTSFNVKERL